MGMFKNGTSNRDFHFTGKPWIYIASPYTNGDLNYNVQRQLEAKLNLIELGVMPIDPIPASHLFHEEFCQLSYRTWINYTAELESRCNGLLRLPGKSAGADGEVSLAINDFNIPVFYDYTMLEDALRYWVPEDKQWDIPANKADVYQQFRTFSEIITR
jgi:hypothetical protein